MRFVQRDFSAGELSPQTRGRIDMPYFYRGAQIMENYIPLPTGSVVRRPGTLALFKTKPPGSKGAGVRCYAVEPNSDNSYILLIYKQRLSCYRVDSGDWPYVPMYPDGGTDYLDVTNVPWENLDIDKINITTIGLNVYLTHYSFPPVVVSFVSNNIRYGTIGSFFNEFNPKKTDGYKIGTFVNYQRYMYAATRDITGAVAGADVVTPFGSIEAWEDIGEAFSTLPSSWKSGDRGTVVYKGYYWTYWEDGIVIPAGIVILGILTAGGAVAVYSAQRQHEIRKAQEAELALGSPPHEKLTSRWRRGSRALAANAPEWASGQAYTVGTKVRYGNRMYQARVAHTSSTNQEPDKDVAWKFVAESPLFNEAGRYPHLIFGYEGRLLALGCVDNPSIIWGSQTGGKFNFSGGLNDSDAFIIKIDGEGDNFIEWVTDISGLTIGTSSGEWRVTGAQGGPLTPTSVQALRQSSVGSYGGHVIVNDMLLFLDRSKKNIKRFVFSNDTRSYHVPNIGEVSKHLFENEIRAMAVQNNPYIILWLVMKDGSLVSGTYMGDYISFAKHSSLIKYTDVTVSKGNDTDHVIFTANNAIYMMAPIDQKEHFAYLDNSEFLTIKEKYEWITEPISGDPRTGGILGIAYSQSMIIAITRNAIIQKTANKDEWLVYDFGSDRVRYDSILSKYSAVTYYEDRDAFIVTGNNTGVISLDPTTMNMTILHRESIGSNVMTEFLEVSGYMICYGKGVSSVAVPSRLGNPVVLLNSSRKSMINDALFDDFNIYTVTNERYVAYFRGVAGEPITLSMGSSTSKVTTIFSVSYPGYTESIKYFIDTENINAQKTYNIFRRRVTVGPVITKIPSRILFADYVADHFVFFTASHVYIWQYLDDNDPGKTYIVNCSPANLTKNRVTIDKDNGIIFVAGNKKIYQINVNEYSTSTSDINTQFNLSAIQDSVDINGDLDFVGDSFPDIYKSTYTGKYVSRNVSTISDSAVIDGNLVEDFEGYTTGGYDVPESTQKVYVGNQYSSTLQPQRYTPKDGDFDTDIRVARVGVTVHDTKMIKIGTSEHDLDEIIEPNVPITGGEVPDLYTGTLDATVDHTYNGPWPRIVQKKPFPGEIQGVAYEIQGGRS